MTGMSRKWLQNPGGNNRDDCRRSVSGLQINKQQAKKLVSPTEPVTPVDDKRVDSASNCNSDLPIDNRVTLSAITLYQIVRHLTAPVTLAESIKTTAMVDSGTMGNFIHLRFVKEHNLVTKSRMPFPVVDVNGHLLTHANQQVKTRMAIGNHSEILTFDVIPLGAHNLILGLSWLQQHDLQLHWASGKITFTSDYCEAHCLALPASTILNQRPLVQPPPKTKETLDPEPEPVSAEEVEIFVITVPKCLEHLKEVIPEEYWDFLDVFDGEKATTTLPELCGSDIDFAIELDPTKPLPKPSCPYHMNQEERAECHKVLDEMLSAKWIKPTDANCPIAAPMFFVWKKDGTR